VYWFYLTIAILLEVGGTVCMKLSDSFANLVPSVLVFVLYGASFALMMVTLRGLDLAIVYGVWSGAGTAAIAIIGVVSFGESMTLVRAFSLGLVVIGVVGLKLSA
jgi:small multidrug resistance pump